LETLKNFPNMDQDNNVYFNEIEGWDKIIDKDRVVYRIPTSSSTNWTGTGSTASDGESVTLTASGDGNLLYGDDLGLTANTLEANRVRFKLRGSGSVELKAVRSYNGGTASPNRLNWDNDNFILLDDNWLSIDLPFVSGAGDYPASSSSIYQTGTRYNVAITSGSSFDYIDDLKIFRVEYNADSGDTLQIKDVEYYKSIDWSVHSIRDYNDEYMCLECVRTVGKRDSLRRAYGE